MLLFAPIAILAASFVGILVAARLNDDPRRSWLIASGGAALAWLAMLYLRFQLPLSAGQPLFQSAPYREYALAWQMDGLAWSLAFGFISYYLIYTLSQVTDFAEEGPSFWLVNALWALLASASALAANPLTLAIIWLLLALLAIYVQSRKREPSQDFAAWRLGLSLELLAIPALLLIWLTSQSPGLAYSGTPAIQVLALLAFRLGVLPPQAHLLSPDQRPSQQGFAFLARLFPGLVVLPRLLVSASDPPPLLLAALLLVLTLASLIWLRAGSFSQGQASITVAIIALALLFSAQGAANGSLHWVLILLLLSALLPLFSYIAAYRIVIYSTGLWLFAPLGFSPNFSSGTLISASNLPVSLAYLLCLALLLFGWLRHTRELKALASRIQSWQRTVFSSSILLSLLLLILLPLGLLPLTYANVQATPLWFLAALAALVTLIALYGQRFMPSLASLLPLLQIALSLDWHLRWLTRLAEWLAAPLRILARLLEGNAGLLWALLLIVLMLSLISQFNPTG